MSLDEPLILKGLTECHLRDPAALAGDDRFDLAVIALDEAYAGYRACRPPRYSTPKKP
jgi:hypothetical protein